jgi:peptidoglycan/LPS O-acetylase OafA/YrhL
MAGRATQLDGLRAWAMIGVACVHWLPREWRGPFPFEIGLFFFLTLSGCLITTVLLKERERGEVTGLPWRATAMKKFQLQRGLRILAPYYAALALAWILGASDLRAAPGWYLAQLTNFHIALVGRWPDFTSHFWSLAVQQQFYLLWPFVVWFVPRRALVPVMFAIASIAPISRLLEPWLARWFPMPDLGSWTSCDYLGLGAVFAVWTFRGLRLDHPGLKSATWIGFAGYTLLYAFDAAGHRVPGVYAVQQTLLAVACCGTIAGATRGFVGWRARALDHPAIQHLGKLSYSLYLFHNLAPLVAGWTLPWLWKGELAKETPGLLVRLPVFALLAWALAWLSWRWLEVPLQGVKKRMSETGGTQKEA